MNAALNKGPAQRAPSYYTASLNDHTEYPQLKGTVQVDVAIIGGGFTGVATAVEPGRAWPEGGHRRNQPHRLGCQRAQWWPGHRQPVG